MNRVRAEDKIGTVVNGWKVIGTMGKDRYGTTTFRIASLLTGRIVENALLGVANSGKYSHHIARRKRCKWSNKRLCSIYYGMVARCYNPDSANYKYYGKRNIAVCQEWLDDPEAFEEWALENGYRNGLTIDRINYNGNYEPNNCRWIPLPENAKWHGGACPVWVENYVDTMNGWSLRIGKCITWFRNLKRNRGYDYAYQRLLEEIDKLGGIKKVMGVNEEHDISQFLEDIENDCLEVDL